MDIFQFRAVLAPNLALKCKKKLHAKNAENSSPTRGFLQITMGEIKKAPQAKIFVIGTIFTPEIAQKCKKWPTGNPGRDRFWI